MELLIIYTLLVYQLQIAEPLTRYRWQPQFRFEGPLDSVDQVSRLLDRYRIERKKNVLLQLLFNRSTPEQRKRNATDESSPDRIPIQIRSSPCFCESQYEMKDFGDGYYPRYVAVSRCKPKTCQNNFHSCKQLQYRVHVLKLREVNASSKDWFMVDDSLPETPLPKPLRVKWQLQSIFVPVGCVPV